ncbi:IS3 family transposase [Sulfurimonas sp. MAG313]|nr:IS3 family transposase [Sulfurimonas sp. MAG313]MDF1881159.1 IS3 family transposase [Sulfurimonas sp. MAG313]
MSRKRTTYTAEFKAKIVIEVLRDEESLNEIASQYKLLPKNLQNWKKQFLKNASIAFDKSTVVKEYKDEIEKLKKEKDATSKKLGEVIIERDFVVEKLQSSVSCNAKKEMVEIEHTLSVSKQLRLLGLSKTAYKYIPVTPFSSGEEIKLLNLIDTIHTKYPYYGTRRVMRLLRRLGYTTGRKLIKTIFAFMGIRALYPKVRTTKANKEHKKYPYLLNAFKNDSNQVIINKPNQVWSTDITYIRLEKGFAYLAAIIDWNTKKILSWRLSNTMDVLLTTSVLNEALANYPKPDIVNTDQGSQYTAKAHIDILVQKGIAISMDGKGRSIDNIVIERFWRTIKYEDIYPSSYSNIKEARKGIKEYMDIYNKERLHSALDYLTPNEAYYKGANHSCFDARNVLLTVA